MLHSYVYNYLYMTYSINTQINKQTIHVKENSWMLKTKNLSMWIITEIPFHKDNTFLFTGAEKHGFQLDNLSAEHGTASNASNDTTQNGATSDQMNISNFGHSHQVLLPNATVPKVIGHGSRTHQEVISLPQIIFITYYYIYKFFGHMIELQNNVPEIICLLESSH